MTAGTGAPALSVVVPSVNGWADLDRCLGALERERADTSMEVLVPARCGLVVLEASVRKYPWARHIPVDVTTTIPQMRAIAFRRAQAPKVAVIEDHVIVRPGWSRAMIAACTPEARVVGAGLVNTATDTMVDWAAWLCEYNHLAAPPKAGAVDGIHGNHTVYDRELLRELRDVAESGRWEDALHSAARAKGVTLWSRPDIVAGHEKHYTVGEYTSQRFLYSRAYAAMRTSGAGPAKRLISGGIAFALPPVLFYRIVSRVWRGGLYKDHLAASLPLLALFVCSWGLGEVAGAWFGDGGALAKVK
jgi:hypothetical protein